jgi:hypothetical protein
VARAHRQREGDAVSLVAAAGRAVVVLFWIATSACAFLTSVPFVFEQFLEPGLVPALTWFARWHGWLTVAMVAPTVAAVWPDLASRRAAVAGSLLIWASVMAGVAAAVGSPLTQLRPGGLAVVASMAALAPLVWLAAIDFALAPWPDTPRATDMTGRDGMAAAGSALAVLLLQTPIAAATIGAVSGLGLAQSAAAHFVLFGAVFTGLAVVRAVADLTSKPAQWEAVAAAAWLAALAGGAAALVLLPALSVSAWPGRAAVFVFGAVIASVLAARGLRLGRARERDGVVLVMSGLLPRWALSRTRWARLGWVAVLVAIGLAARGASGAMDWNFTVAKLGAVVLWLLVLATIVQWSPAHVRLHPAVPHAACAAVLAAFLISAGRVPGGPVTLEAATRAADVWVVGDPSYRTLRDWLHRPAGAAVEAADGVGFFDFLHAHTNIARSVAVAPVPIQLADLTAAAPGPRPPHLFVFVVDSLRRDYLSPYNRAVTFTPAIDAFARESTVFSRSFTRYGATGLSVPSIWVVLHTQYVTPFAPMNTLHALLAHHDYRRWISMDNIVEVVMPRDDSLEPLDERRVVADFRACSTIDELRGRLDRLTPGGPPAFVWALPQDLHVAVLTREGQRAVDDGDYDGFYPPYASRVHRFDGCFGGFIDDLKRRGLYDQSVIVLTSDHGDSLGEKGRWGHAYTLYPEVLQVPLVVRVPPALAARFEASPDDLSFTTDITPTLHTLLGHDVRPSSPVFGRPLFRPRGTVPLPAQTFGLVASSYGSVYGWIGADGGDLYIADGVGLRDYHYRLDGSSSGLSEPVSAAARAAGQRAIRQGIQAIAEVYRFTPLMP